MPGVFKKAHILIIPHVLIFTSHLWIKMSQLISSYYYGVVVGVSSTVPLGIAQSFKSHLIGLRFPHIENFILGADESVTLMKRVVFWVFLCTLPVPLMSTEKLSWQV